METIEQAIAEILGNPFTSPRDVATQLVEKSKLGKYAGIGAGIGAAAGAVRGARQARKKGKGAWKGALKGGAAGAAVGAATGAVASKLRGIHRSRVGAKLRGARKGGESAAAAYSKEHTPATHAIWSKDPSPPEGWGTKEGVAKGLKKAHLRTSRRAAYRRHQPVKTVKKAFSKRGVSPTKSQVKHATKELKRGLKRMDRGESPF